MPYVILSNCLETHFKLIPILIHFFTGNLSSHVLATLAIKVVEICSTFTNWCVHSWKDLLYFNFTFFFKRVCTLILTFTLMLLTCTTTTNATTTPSHKKNWSILLKHTTLMVSDYKYLSFLPLSRRREYNKGVLMENNYYIRKRSLVHLLLKFLSVNHATLVKYYSNS